MFNLLPEEVEKGLITVCRTVVGDSLRSLTYFNRFDYVQVCLHEDLEREAGLSSFIGNGWHGFKVTQDAYHGSGPDNCEYTIHVFENGYLVRTTVEGFGVLVTTDGISVQGFEALAAATAKAFDEWAIEE